TDNDGRFELDFDLFEQRIKENDVKLFILCSPHNPAGRVWTEDELERMLSICEKHDVLVIADEIHQDFAYGEHKHVPAPVVAGGKYTDRIVLVNAASKSFNLPGLLHANIVIENDDLRQQFDNYAGQHIQSEKNMLGHIATEAAYETGEAWLDGLRSVLLSNYDYIREQLAEHNPEAKVSKLEGSCLPSINLSGFLAPADTQACTPEQSKLAVGDAE